MRFCRVIIENEVYFHLGRIIYLSNELTTTYAFDKINKLLKFYGEMAERSDSGGACKERSDGIAIARHRRNRVKPCNGFLYHKT